MEEKGKKMRALRTDMGAEYTERETVTERRFALLPVVLRVSGR